MGSPDDDGASAQTDPDLGAAPGRRVVEADTVRRLVAEQFPQWSGLPVTPVAQGGWDNCTFHLGDDLLVRLPSAAEYALAVEKEHHWLPLLARQLPLPIPAPRGRGVPGAGYPFAWSVYGWLDGGRASLAGIADPVELAGHLADFLVSLRSVDPTEGPRPGVHNWFRGGTLRTFDETARSALAEVGGHLDVDVVTQIWDAALSAPSEGADTWFHGDLAPANLLLEDGRLAAVIDFGTCGVGDPSCDLAIAWTLLTEPGRQAFRDRLAVDDDEWARGRGWALWKTLTQLATAIEDADADGAAEARRVLDEIAADHPGAPS